MKRPGQFSSMRFAPTFCPSTETVASPYQSPASQAVYVPAVGTFESTLSVPESGGVVTGMAVGATA